MKIKFTVLSALFVVLCALVIKFSPQIVTATTALWYDTGTKIYSLSANKVGVGTSNPTQQLEINGGVRLNTSTARPSCTTSVRGTLWFTYGVGTSKDSLYLCAQAAGTTVPSWKTIY